MTRRSSRRARAGYTLIEVMMAIAIITASAVALVGMQEIVVRGNMDARQTTTATTIVRTTIELLRLDALNWNQSYATAGTVAWGTNSRGFLRDAPTAATAAPTPWAAFGTQISAPEHAYDYQGNVANGNEFYCVETRYAWVYPGQALRADVRVWWVRPNPALTSVTPPTPCSSAVTQLLDSRVTHSVQGTTVLRYTPPGIP